MQYKKIGFASFCSLILVLGFTGELKAQENTTLNGSVEEKANPDSPSTLPEYSKNIKMESGKTGFLFERTLPSNFSTKSNDENIAVSNRGILVAKSAGNTTIRIFDGNSQEVGQIHVEVLPVKEDIYDEMRHRWEDILTGGNYYNENDPVMKSIQNNKDAAVKTLWNEMDKSSDRTFLWKDTSSLTASATITQSYRNLYKMAEAFVSPASPYYLNEQLLRDTLSALEWMYNNRYNESLSIYGNWWDWEIGAPRAINDILTVLYPVLSTKDIMKYTEPINKFVPDVNYMMATLNGKKQEATGANQIDISKVKMIQNVLRKNSEEIIKSKSALSKVLLYVDKGEGFYQDGSFIQHTNIPYTGSYGNVLIDGLSQLLTVVQNTEFQIDDPNLKNVYEWIESSFAPVIYKGSLMDMVRGRAISRENSQDHAASMEVIRAIARFTEFAPEETSLLLKKKVKQWLVSDSYFNYIPNVGNYRDMYLAREILNNSEIPVEKEEQLFKNFANMDRVVYKNPTTKFAFGISMHSTRVQNYEDMNNENRKGWYTGDGMTYLYNEDLSHYSDGYWATVDPYRLPGTTVETSSRNDGSGETVSTRSFVGASSLNNVYGSVAMDFENWNKQLEAKKSWFTFGDKVIALGAGINSSSDNPIETIVENRKLVKDTNYNFIIDGVNKGFTKGNQQLNENTKWLLLESSNKDQSIGYLFPKAENINVKYESRSGAWKNINSGQSSQVVNNDFFTMWIDHGTRVKNEDYAYIIYPNATTTKLKKEAEDASVDIVANTNEVQAVKDKGLGLIGVNLWTDKEFKIDNLTIYNKSSVTVEEKEGILTISVSDPTMLNESGIKLSLDHKHYKVMSKSENISVKDSKNSIEITVDTKGLQGQSSQVVLKKTNNSNVRNQENRGNKK